MGWNVRLLVAATVLGLLAPAVQAGRIELLSIAGDDSDTALALGARYPLYTQTVAVSADGRWVAFNSAPLQRRGRGLPNVFLHDRETGTTVLVSHAAGSPGVSPGISADGASANPPAISDDGRWIVYESAADNLVPGQTPGLPAQVFLYDRETGVNTLVSRSSGGAAFPRISGDGEWIVFESDATDLVPGQVDTPHTLDVFLHERATGRTTLVSRAGDIGNAPSDRPAISRDGRWVAFRSQASNLVPGFTGATAPANVFLFDRTTGTTTLVSHTAGSATAGAGGWIPEISPDGAAVVFGSFATDLVPGQTDTPGTWDLFLFDRASGRNLLVSRVDASPTTCDGASVLHGRFQVSAGGDWVVFQNRDAGYRSQIRLFQRADASVTLVSRSAASPARGADGDSSSPRITPDGAFVVFESAAGDLVPGQDGPATGNVFVFDRAAGTLTLASGAGGSGQTAGNGSSSGPGVSADGSVVAFYTRATDLVPGAAGPGGTVDVALYDGPDPRSGSFQASRK